MKEQGYSRAESRLLPGRLALALLAVSYLILITYAYTSSGLCFYNWSDQWWAAALLALSALGLLSDKWWGKMAAIAISGLMIYRFCHAALKVHRVLPLTPDEEAMWMTPDVWWGLILRSPDSYIPLALATTILTYSVISLVTKVTRSRLMLP